VIHLGLRSQGRTDIYYGESEYSQKKPETRKDTRERRDMVRSWEPPDALE
jgi:hypothetical protein